MAGNTLTLDYDGQGNWSGAGSLGENYDSTDTLDINHKGGGKYEVAGNLGGVSRTVGVSFTEDGSTTLTATVEIPAGALLEDVGFLTTVLWDDTGAVALIIGDDDDDNGWFASTDLKATDLLVGEVLSAADNGTWGGKNGAYLVDATGRRGRTTAGVDSGWYCGAATEVIFKVTAANGDGSAGRSFGWVRYSIPTMTAAA